MLFRKYILKLISYKKHDAKLCPRKIKKILILRYDRIGDMVVTMPLIETIKHSYPHYQIDVLGSDANKSIIKNHHAISSIFIYNFRTKRKILEFIKIFWRLRKQKYDLLIDPFFNNLSRSTGHLRLINATFNIGIEKNKKYGLCSDDFKLFYGYTPFDKTKTLMQNILKIATLLDIKSIDFKKSIDFNIYDEESLILKFLKPYSKKKKILFNIQGSAKKRSFNDDFIISLSSKLAQDTSNQVIIISMPERQKILQKKLDTLCNENIILSKTKTILDAVALTKNVDLVISPDTSIIHIASCFDKQIIGFYKKDEFNRNIFSPFSTDYHIFTYDNLHKLDERDSEIIYNDMNDKGYV